VPVLLPASAEARFQLDARSVEAAWTPRTRGVLLASPSNPTGIYAWADCSAHFSTSCANSWDFTFDVMRRAHVAITPGRDFGRHATERFVRLSYASSMARLQEAVERLRLAL
jgi:aspartate/methionine/tyrosine aminotransferase